MLAQVSLASGQKECFNNPVVEFLLQGDTLGECPPIGKLKYIVSYGDPAPSNTTGKKAKKN